jgi:Excalibur calcium-binding domain
MTVLIRDVVERFKIVLDVVLSMRSLAATLLIAAPVGFWILLPVPANADLDCSNFSTQAAAQEAFIAAGGPTSDPNGLDADGDGVACESLPCPCTTATLTPPPQSALPEEPVAPQAEHLVYWKSFGVPAEVEPRKIVIGTGAGSPLYLSRLVAWRGWGSGRTWAIGKLRINTCRPYCAAGHFTTRRARVVLTKVRDECGQRRYMNVKVRIFGFTVAALGPWGSDCRGAQVRRP